MTTLIQHSQSVADQAELYQTKTRAANVMFSKGEVEVVANRKVAACALRVLKDGRLGSSYAGSADQEELLQDAVSAAAFGQAVAFGFAEEQPVNRTPEPDPHTAELTVADLLDLCQDVKTRILRLEPKAVVNMTCRTRAGTRSIETSHGVQISEGSAHAYLGVELPFADRGTDVGAVAEALSSSPLVIEDPWIEQLVEKRAWGAQASVPASGRLPVLLAPGASNLLTMALLVCLDSRAVAAGLSPLADRVEQQILDTKLTLRENPLDEQLAAKRSFDDEGIACRPRTIIDQGVLKGFLADLNSRSMLEQDAAGNAARRTMFSENIEDVPMPCFLGAVLEPGKTSWRRLLNDLDEGILVTRTMGLHSSNLLQGQYAVQALGFHIRNGKPVGYLERTMLSGNVFEDFLNIRSISSEREPTRQEMLSVAGVAPYILLDSAQVTVG